MFPLFSAPTEAYLIFKLLNKSKTGYLNIDEFYGNFAFQKRFFHNPKKQCFSTFFKIRNFGSILLNLVLKVYFYIPIRNS